MLHAIAQKKSRIYRRYLGERDDPAEKKITAEDEIVSILTGPLAYMTPGSCWAFWLALANHRSLRVECPNGEPTQVDMRFWDKNQKIEPDLRIDFSWKGEKRIFLVEFKWRSSLSGENQLHDQWRHYLSPEEHACATHIFIGLDTGGAQQAVKREDLWAEKIILLTWMDVKSTLESLSSHQCSALSMWSGQASKFLELVGIHSFRGFTHLIAPPIPAGDSVLFRTN